MKVNKVTLTKGVIVCTACESKTFKLKDKKLVCSKCNEQLKD